MIRKINPPRGIGPCVDFVFLIVIVWGIKTEVSELTARFKRLQIGDRRVSGPRWQHLFPWLGAEQGCFAEGFCSAPEKEVQPSFGRGARSDFLASKLLWDLGLSFGLARSFGPEP